MMIIFYLFFNEPIQRKDDIMIFMSLEMSYDFFNNIFELSIEVDDTVLMYRMTTSWCPLDLQVLMMFLKIADSFGNFIFIDGAIIHNGDLKHVEPFGDFLFEVTMIGGSVFLEQVELDSLMGLLLYGVVG